MRTDNKLIALFMGSEEDFRGEFDLYGTTGLNAIFEDVESNDNEAKHFFTPEEMKFHKDWNWLMTVVERIELINIEVNGILTSPDVIIAYGDCTIRDEDGIGLFEFYVHSTDSNYKFGATYKAVVEFIKWYNENYKS